MADPTRLEAKLAEALGLAQAARGAAAAVAERVDAPKVRARVGRMAEDAALWQERLNELVVADPATRDTLTARARHIRDAAERLRDERLGRGDELEACELLVGLAAREVAHWRFIAVLAKAEGDGAVRALAEEALPRAERHLDQALKASARVAKGVARAERAERADAAA